MSELEFLQKQINLNAKAVGGLAGFLASISDKNTSSFITELIMEWIDDMESLKSEFEDK